MADDPNESVRLFDLAPDGATGAGRYAGPPADFQVTRGRAAELMAAFAGRFRLAQAGEPVPTVRSDGQPIIPEQSE